MWFQQWLPEIFMVVGEFFFLRYLLLPFFPHWACPMWAFEWLNVVCNVNVSQKKLKQFETNEEPFRAETKSNLHCAIHTHITRNVQTHKSMGKLLVSSKMRTLTSLRFSFGNIQVVPRSFSSLARSRSLLSLLLGHNLPILNLIKCVARRTQ